MQLLHSKAQYYPTFQDAEGFPRVERDLLQVEHFSQKLRAKVTRTDHGEDAFAATRLLAQEGLNNRRQG